MENRKHQFFGFIVILLIVGFLNYFRKIANGLKLSKTNKVIYLTTMVVFVISIMFVLYFTEINNIISFVIGLTVAHLSEHIAKLFLTVGDNFNIILAKIIKKFFKIDLIDELTKYDDNKSKNNKNKNLEEKDENLNSES